MAQEGYRALSPGRVLVIMGGGLGFRVLWSLLGCALGIRVCIIMGTIKGSRHVVDADMA